MTLRLRSYSDFQPPFTPLRCAITHRVSPRCTTYEPPADTADGAGDADGDAGDGADGAGGGGVDPPPPAPLTLAANELTARPVPPTHGSNPAWMLVKYHESVTLERVLRSVMKSKTL